jgi:hypothetical protein
MTLWQIGHSLEEEIDRHIPKGSTSDAPFNILAPKNVLKDRVGERITRDPRFEGNHYYTCVKGITTKELLAGCH